MYNAAVLWNPQDHVPNKWYVLPYPAPCPIGGEVGEPYDTAEDAERAARTWHAEAAHTPDTRNP